MLHICKTWFYQKKVWTCFKCILAFRIENILKTTKEIASGDSQIKPGWGEIRERNKKGCKLGRECVIYVVWLKCKSEDDVNEEGELSAST